ncbi:hypothetical protein BIY24_06190 [Halobacteriovorax marinus]|uniref:ankyrin repeat domain-containing protein n=1 Tax=Halobacteriovorax marinus TaxID=97084 RepID=UPI000BC320BA|nr:ankyrin repeat domain-containing protein [Halobacteriovorax marinus]ATH07547.1 hypothetical protein BIY24_06190 [Halobacteriovorax marinus]
MKHILIVDDDLDIHGLFKIHFKDLDYKLHFATDVEEALIHLEHDDVAFIFLDIIIGDNETSHRILRNSGDRPIFLMSSHITDDFCQRVVEKNVNILDCLAKPFTKKDIVNLLSDYKNFAYGKKKFNPNEDTHFVEGKREDIGEEHINVKGHKELSESIQLISGDEPIAEKAEVVRGGEHEEEEEVIHVTSDLNEDFDEHFTIVSGDYSEPDREEVMRVKRLHELEELREKGPLSRTDAGYSRLMISVFLESKDEVAQALDDGIKIDLLCRGGFSALHFAVMKDLYEIAEFLIQRGAKLTVKDNDGREPLYFAIFRGNLDLVKLMVEAGAPLNRRVNGKSYLMIAALKRHEVLFKYLLSQGVSLAVRDSEGFNINYYLKKLKLEHYLMSESA